MEPTGAPVNMLYSCPNVEIEHRLVRVNVGAPTYMRAPGEASGSFGQETAMDELAVALNMDPVDLRMRNYAEIDESTGRDWSSKSLSECYDRRRAALRMVAAQCAAGLDARWTLADRLGHGHRCLSGQLPPGRREGAHVSRTAASGSAAARRISAPAPTRSSRRLPRTSSALRPTKCAWRSATAACRMRRPRAARARLRVRARRFSSRHRHCAPASSATQPATSARRCSM